MSNARAWLGFLAMGWVFSCGGSTATELGGELQAGGGAGQGSGGSSDSAGASGSASTSGAAGSGLTGSGGAGTGGTGGTITPTVDASTPGDGSAVIFDASDCNCLPASIRWGQDGGRVAFTDTSEVSPCKTYSHMRDNRGNAAPITCKQELLACGSNSIGIGDLTAALRNADVQQAIRSAPVLFGRDTRPVDGTVLRLVIGGAVVEIGSPCAAGAGCKAVPPGVAALAEVLSVLDRQELGKPPCSTTFAMQ